MEAGRCLMVLVVFAVVGVFVAELNDDVAAVVASSEIGILSS